MNIYVYADESGVFDKVHNDYFVFGGVVFLSNYERENANRKYIAAERAIQQYYSKGQELKATVINNKHKRKLYRSLNGTYKFGVVIKQKEVLDQIFWVKKSKQRYLDYAFKIAIKRFLESLIKNNTIIPAEVCNVCFYIDEHNTATNGLYELREGLLEEFKYGTINYNYNKFFPPIFSQLGNVYVNYYDSKQKPLIRAADIVANNIYHRAVSEMNYIVSEEKLHIIKLP